MELYYPNNLEFTPVGDTEVTIQGKEYLTCDRASKLMWCNGKKGKYGKGLVNTSSDPYRATRTGLLGEVAFAKLFNLGVDTTYHEGGAIADFIVKGYKIDLKTSIRDYGLGLIYKTSESGIEITLKSDIYVFAYLKSEERINNTATVKFVGYYTVDLVTRNGIVAKGRKTGSKHYNYEIPHSNLKDMFSLKELIL